MKFQGYAKALQRKWRARTSIELTMVGTVTGTRLDLLRNTNQTESPRQMQTVYLWFFIWVMMFYSIIISSMLGGMGSVWQSMMERPRLWESLKSGSLRTKHQIRRVLLEVSYWLWLILLVGSIYSSCLFEDPLKNVAKIKKGALWTLVCNAREGVIWDEVLLLWLLWLRSVYLWYMHITRP